VTTKLRKQVGVTNVYQETVASINVAAVFLETAPVYKTTWHHAEEQGILNAYCLKKFKSYRIVLIWWRMSVPYRTLLRNSHLTFQSLKGNKLYVNICSKI
jgi:hypothetical protein